MARFRLARALAVSAVALSLTACGQAPPQAPFGRGEQLRGALAALAVDCGRAEELLQFRSADRAGLESIDRRAMRPARAVVSLRRQGADWTFQSATIATIAGDEAAQLRRCGLDRSAAILAS
jgi:hypothetical protein